MGMEQRRLNQASQSDGLVSELIPFDRNHCLELILLLLKNHIVDCRFDIFPCTIISHWVVQQKCCPVLKQFSNVCIHIYMGSTFDIKKKKKTKQKGWKRREAKRREEERRGRCRSQDQSRKMPA